MNDIMQIFIAVIIVSVIGTVRFNEEPKTEQTLNAEIVDIANDQQTIILNIKNLPKKYPIQVLYNTEIQSVTNTPLRFQDLEIGDNISIILTKSNNEYFADTIERM